MTNRLCDLQTNYLQTNGFQLILPRFPLVTFYSTSFSMPSVGLDAAKLATPLSNIAVPGDKLAFAPFQFQFMIDDRMQNYREIHDWLLSIGMGTSHQRFTNYENKGQDKHQTLGEQDAKVVILSSKSNPVAHITFHDAFPISLGGMEFNVQDPQTTYMMATAAFEYTYFDFDPA